MGGHDILTDTNGQSKKRMCYDGSFKLQVVQEALKRPENNRIKPTCARYPGIEPCQLRKWIRNFESQMKSLPFAAKKTTTVRSAAHKRQRDDHNRSPTLMGKPVTPSKSLARPQRRRAPAPEVDDSDAGEGAERSDQGDLAEESRLFRDEGADQAKQAELEKEFFGDSTRSQDIQDNHDVLTSFAPRAFLAEGSGSGADPPLAISPPPVTMGAGRRSVRRRTMTPNKHCEEVPGLALRTGSPQSRVLEAKHNELVRIAAHQAPAVDLARFEGDIAHASQSSYHRKEWFAEWLSEVASEDSMAGLGLESPAWACAWVHHLSPP